ncbi:MAG TPA: polyhydroxyalkanoate depolymerase [Gammaproteobacteria bacterium]|nr:polyhydroxyalkanoate depolymerase [Gammaproteobacteria bacterium]
MLYHFYELNHAAIAPLRSFVAWNRLLFDRPWNPWTQCWHYKTARAAWDVFEHLTRRYGKPAFGIDEVEMAGARCAVSEEVVWSRPFCELLHFKRDPAGLPPRHRDDPRVLLVAPMSGHYATLLRGTVRALLPDHEVYVTDWADARTVPLALGEFDLDDYVDYVIEMLRFLGPNTHVIAVCQPGPAVLAATSLLAADGDACVPASMTIMGSPIDTRKSPTEPNRLATTRSLEWFERNVIMPVPFPHAGCMRRVYPGFLQLTGFMTMNLDRHMDAHQRLYQSLVKGDGDSVQAHRDFYDEYLAVMDLDAPYYLQTLKVVFQEHQLARGEMRHRGRLVEPAAITQTALLTVEGEKDDISGIGQTQAAHALCVNIPPAMKRDYVQAGVGHYGVFNGSRFRAEIAPRIRDFIRSHYRR